MYIRKRLLGLDKSPRSQNISEGDNGNMAKIMKLCNSKGSANDDDLSIVVDFEEE